MEEKIGKEIQGGKEKESMIRKGSGIIKGERKEIFDQRGHRKKKKVFEGEKERFFEGQSSRLLGLVFCLID